MRTSKDLLKRTVEEMDRQRAREMGQLFTPRLRSTNERLRMLISAEDKDKVLRGGPWTAVVTDVETGKVYRADGAECSAGPHCFCDAVVEEVEAKSASPQRLDAKDACACVIRYGTFENGDRLNARTRLCAMHAQAGRLLSTLRLISRFPGIRNPETYELTAAERDQIRRVLGPAIDAADPKASGEEVR